jgi:hypothetical protein
LPRSYLHDLEGLDFTSVLDVRSPTEIDQGTTAVNRALLTRHQLIDIMKLIFAVGEHLLEVLLRDFEAIEALLFLEDTRGLAVQGRPIGFTNDAAVTKSVPSNPGRKWLLEV